MTQRAGAREATGRRSSVRRRRDPRRAWRAADDRAAGPASACTNARATRSRVIDGSRRPRHPGATVIVQIDGDATWRGSLLGDRSVSMQMMRLVTGTDPVTSRIAGNSCDRGSLRPSPVSRRQRAEPAPTLQSLEPRRPRRVHLPHRRRSARDRRHRRRDAGRQGHLRQGLRSGEHQHARRRSRPTRCSPSARSPSSSPARSRCSSSRKASCRSTIACRGIAPTLRPRQRHHAARSRQSRLRLSRLLSARLRRSADGEGDCRAKIC